MVCVTVKYSQRNYALREKHQKQKAPLTPHQPPACGIFIVIKCSDHFGAVDIVTPLCVLSSLLLGDPVYAPFEEGW